MGGVSAAVSKTAAAPIERIKLLIQNQVRVPCRPVNLGAHCVIVSAVCLRLGTLLDSASEHHDAASAIKPAPVVSGVDADMMKLNLWIGPLLIYMRYRMRC